MNRPSDDEVADLIKLRDELSDLFKIGSACRTAIVIMANVENVHRREKCLTAVEREFFMRPGEPDEDDPEAPIEPDCVLNWGAAPDQYVQDFRAALSSVSDGYHTMDELYAHRYRLFSVLMHAYSARAWWSRTHFDGSDAFGGAICGIYTPAGHVTYHLPDSEVKHLPLACLIERGREWDGHTPANVLERLLSLPTAAESRPELIATQTVYDCLLRALNDMQATPRAMQYVPQWLRSWGRTLQASGLTPSNPNAPDIQRGLAVLAHDYRQNGG